VGNFTFSDSRFSQLRQNVPVTVLVIGSTGQDGSILCDLLNAHSINYVGVSRNSISSPGKITERAVDLSQFETSQSFLDQVKPSHIIHLAAVHAPSGSMFAAGELLFDEMYKCHVQITKNILEWQLKHPKTKSLIALSSQMYSPQKQHPMITLNSQINPSSKYGETKAESWKLIKLYRAKYGVKSYGLILFNHTSSRSKPDFLFPELARQFLNILEGKSDVIKIRDTEAFVDIFSAEELGEGLIRCIKSEFTQDLIFSSGGYVKISDVIRNTAEILGMQDTFELFSTHPTDRLIPLFGDISNTFEILKWRPVSTPSEILAKMVKIVRYSD
jgi:nucleoside-diphosphate-sugar epimerase